MLANGITLGLKADGGNTYNVLAGLKEVPELGVEPEKVENTTLGDDVKIYEFGIGDAGDLTYKFRWDDNSAAGSYRTLRALADAKKKAEFEQTFPDGTKFQFVALCNVKVGGGGVNAAIDFTLNLALQGKITVIDPS